MSNNSERVVPEYMRRVQGELKIGKGSLDPSDGEVQLYQWDAVADCVEVNCPIFSLCPYEKKGKCMVELKYLKSVNVMLFKNFKDVIDEPTFFRIGMHLLPLYKSLCKMKMYELKVTDVVWEDANGKLKAEPIYKEIRDTIKLIEQVWRSTGLNKLQVIYENPELDMGGEPKKYATMGDIPIDEFEKEQKKKKKKRRMVRRSG